MPTSTIAPEDVLHLAHRALNKLTDPKLTREGALSAAVSVCHKTRCAWVKDAFARGVLEARCLGRFDLENPLLPEVPWPAVMFAVRTMVKGLHGVENKSCVLALHMSPQNPEDWLVTDSEVVRTTLDGGVVHVNGRPFCGNPEGPWGLLNGDGPVSLSRPEPAPSADPPASSPADRARPQGPARSSTPREPAADRPAKRARRRGCGRAASESAASSTPLLRSRASRPSPNAKRRTRVDHASDKGTSARADPGSSTALSPKMELALRLLRLIQGP